MNWVRVFSGGLVAGLFNVVSGIVLGHFVLGEEYVRDFKNALPTGSPVTMAVQHLSIRIGSGVLLAFLYAAMRPRFGAGLKTAAMAGGVLWLGAGSLMVLVLNQLGVLTGTRLYIVLPWSVGEYMIAASIAGAIYRERPATSP